MLKTSKPELSAGHSECIRNNIHRLLLSLKPSYSFKVKKYSITCKVKVFFIYLLGGI